MFSTGSYNHIYIDTCKNFGLVNKKRSLKKTKKIEDNIRRQIKMKGRQHEKNCMQSR